MLARASLLSLALRELTIKMLSRDPGLIHADDMPGPLELGFYDHYLDAGGLRSLEDFEVCYLVLPVDVEYGPEAVHIERFQRLDVAPVGCPDLTAIEERREDHSSVNQQFCRQPYTMVFNIPVCKHPSAWLALQLLV